MEYLWLWQYYYHGYQHQMNTQWKAMEHQKHMKGILIHDFYPYDYYKQPARLTMKHYPFTWNPLIISVLSGVCVHGACQENLSQVFDCWVPLIGIAVLVFVWSNIGIKERHQSIWTQLRRRKWENLWSQWILRVREYN